MAQHVLQMLRRSATKCRTFFDKHYLLANVATYAGLYTAGDITCQIISHANTTQPHNWERTKRMAIMGSTFLPVMNTYFYRVLDRLFVGASLRVVAGKLFVDTFIWTPFPISIFITGLTALEGKTWQEVKQELRVKFWPIFKAGLMIWPLTQAINFAFVHPRFRMMYISVVGFCWINILSYVKHKQMIIKSHGAE